MNIPTKLKVGGITYKVKLVDSEEFDGKTAAQICASQQWIKVMKTPDAAYMHLSFLHEIFHAMNMEFGEENVEFLAQALYQIIVDNPDVFEKEKKKKKKPKKRGESNG